MFAWIESKEEKPSGDSIIKKKSVFNPPINRDKTLNRNIDSFNSLNFPDFVKSNKKQPFKAVTDGYKRVNKNIQIKEAGKGESALILSKSHYKNMKLSQLNDKKFKFEYHPGNNKIIKALVTKYKPLITDSEYKYLGHNYFETSNFYGRPKTNKSESLHKV